MNPNATADEETSLKGRPYTSATGTRVLVILGQRCGEDVCSAIYCHNRGLHGRTIAVSYKGDRDPD
jgi:hypothetical protein